MRNEKLIRLLIFVFAAVLHLIILLFVVFKVDMAVQLNPENARMMRLLDLDEAPPFEEELPPPPPAEQEIPQVEEIAETMIETDIPPVQLVVPAGTITIVNIPSDNFEDDYLPMHLVSSLPQFDENAIASDLVYPAIALRAGIEGRVILELFVDMTGTVQRVTILQETPEGRGFGEAAVRAFTGRKGTPAIANGEPVSARYRHPVVFRVR